MKNTGRNQLGELLHFEGQLAGHTLTFNMGHQCLNTFCEKMGISTDEAICMFQGGNLAMIMKGLNTLIFCAIQPGPNAPTEYQISQWTEEDPAGMLNIFLSILKTIMSIYSLTEKSN